MAAISTSFVGTLFRSFLCERRRELKRDCCMYGENDYCLDGCWGSLIKGQFCVNTWYIIQKYVDTTSCMHFHCSLNAHSLLCSHYYTELQKHKQTTTKKWMTHFCDASIHNVNVVVCPALTMNRPLLYNCIQETEACTQRRSEHTSGRQPEQ